MFEERHMAQSQTFIPLHRCVPTVTAALLVVLIGGCAHERSSFDTVEGPSIISFESDFQIVTWGEVDDTVVAGVVRLEWRTAGAEAVTLLGNGSPVDLSVCTTNDGDCVEHGIVDLYPNETTVYELRASVGGASCTVAGDGSANQTADCAAQQVSVATTAPAVAELTTTRPTVLSGEWAQAAYAIDQAESWQIGWLDLSPAETVFHPCVPESDFEDNGDFFCLLGEEEVDGESSVGPVGTISIPDLTSSVTLAARASNGADDILGNVRFSDATVTIHVLGNPTLERFAVLDDTVAVNDGVTVQWALLDAERLALSSGPEGAIDGDSATQCQEYSATRASGTCFLALSDLAEVGTVTVTAIAVNGAGDESQAASREFAVGLAPTANLSADPSVHSSDTGTVTLSWSASGADEVTITDDGTPAEVLLNSTPCEGCAAGGSVEVTDVEESAEWFLVAENDFGEVFVHTGSELVSSPAIDGLWIDGDLVHDSVIVDSSEASFEWATDFTLGSSLLGVELEYDDIGCPDDEEAYAHERTFSGATDGSMVFSEIGVPRCAIFAALGVAGQSDVQAFSISRSANIESFEVTENAVAGDEVELSWSATHLSELSFSANHVDADQLAQCGDT